jgi:CRISPR-associated endonuclease/helicase Cas3
MSQSRRRLTLRLHPAVFASWGTDEAARGRLASAVRDCIAQAAISADEDDPFSGQRLDQDRLPGLVSELVDHPDIPDWIRDSLKPWKGPKPVAVERVDPYPAARSGTAPGWLLLGPRVAAAVAQPDDAGMEAGADTEPSDDDGSSLMGTRAVPLGEHLEGVATMAEAFAEAAGLPESLVRAIRHAGRLHDIGKADGRFQIWLHGGDEIAAVSGPPLAKSGTEPTGDESRRARELSGLPSGFRHEAVSVALAAADPIALAGLTPEEADLVLYLIGTHHGRGRPFWPVVDDREDRPVSYLLDGRPLVADPRHGLERLDSGWTDRFWRLLRRYGPWGLALLEAVLTLADGRRSREERDRPPERARRKPVSTSRPRP